MPSQIQYDAMYMDIARRISTMSKANRRVVGSVVVHNGSILSYGYNGTPRGCDNTCEKLVDGKIVSGDTVIHSEMNALYKLLGVGIKITGATMYITAAPCLQCAIAIFQSGIISEVVYHDDYRIDDGIKFLKYQGNGIKVRNFKHDDAAPSMITGTPTNTQVLLMTHFLEDRAVKDGLDRVGWDAHPGMSGIKSIDLVFTPRKDNTDPLYKDLLIMLSSLGWSYNSIDHMVRIQDAIIYRFLKKKGDSSGTYDFMFDAAIDITHLDHKTDNPNVSNS